MALDQYWLVKKDTQEIATHRQFDALEEFLRFKWRDKVKCGELFVDEEIIDELETAANKKEFQPNSGFFFGITSIGWQHKADRRKLLKNVIPKIRELLSEGKIVSYKSSQEFGQIWRINRDKEIAHHTKFNALEGFMRHKWYKQGHTEIFNYEELYIDEELLDQLAGIIRLGHLRPTVAKLMHGPNVKLLGSANVPGALSIGIFGSPDRDQKYQADITELLEVVIPMVRELLNEGKTVVYSSGW